MTHTPDALDVRIRPRRLSPDEVRARLGAPEGMVKDKKKDLIDEHAHRFIAHSPFLTIASANAEGRADSSPRGDYPGFVKVLDEGTLAMPDRPGNNIADTIRNIGENAGVGLLFLVPGMRETLRVNGSAYLTDEPDVLARMRTEAKEPALAIVVEVAEVYFHCGRALLRSRLWDPTSQALAEELPTAGEMATAHLGLDMEPAAFDRVLEDSYRKLF